MCFDPLAIARNQHDIALAKFLFEHHDIPFRFCRDNSPGQAEKTKSKERILRLMLRAD